MAENKFALIVSENISDRRRRLGLSQKKLAERLEISQDAMARMEKGRIAPKMGRLQDIADTLQCSPTCFALTMKLQKSGWSL